MFLLSSPLEQLRELAVIGDLKDRIIRGFFVGVAIGIPVALACCCWYPCFSKESRRRRRRRMQREAREAAARDTETQEVTQQPANVTRREDPG